MRSKIQINVSGRFRNVCYKNGYVNGYFIHLIRNDVPRKINKIYSVDILLTSYLILELSL